MCVDSKNTKLIDTIIESFKIDVVFILDYEKLHSELLAKYDKRVQIVKLDKSSGVIDIGFESKQKQMMLRYTNYFRGINSSMNAYQVSLSIAKYKFYKVKSKLISQCDI